MTSDSAGENLILLPGVGGRRCREGHAMEDVVDAAGYVETQQNTGNVALRIAG